MNTPPYDQCKICGDKASGIKFNIICCGSCKAFFLRNNSNTNINNKKCLKNGKCEINIYTRKNCIKCRFDKCISSGMFIKNGQNGKMQQETNSGLHIRNVLEMTDPKIYTTNPTLFSPIQSTRKRQYATELSSLERSMISRVQNAVNDSFVDESKLPIVGSISSALASFNSSAMYSKRIVQFCRSIPTFKQLNEQDQIVILKPFFFEFLSIRYAFNLCNNAIQNESSKHAVLINLDYLKNFKDQESTNQGMDFQCKLKVEMEDDFTIRDLITIILLFKPREETVTSPELLQYEHVLYCRLLRRYLQHKYWNIQLANRKYLSLIRSVEGFRNRRVSARSMLLSEVETTQLAQILVEIFNI